MRRNLTHLLLVVSSFGMCLGMLVVMSAQNRPERALEEKTSARIPVDGMRIFQDHCARCHGADGRGYGRAVVAVNPSLPDLTRISKKNNGTFPYRGVRNVIEGIEPLARAHGSREMPTWGPIFHQVEADQDWGEVRLDAVTRYIESIQQK